MLQTCNDVVVRSKVDVLSQSSAAPLEQVWANRSRTLFAFDEPHKLARSRSRVDVKQSIELNDELFLEPIYQHVLLVPTCNIRERRIKTSVKLRSQGMARMLPH
jgi:hypothetical protein